MISLLFVCLGNICRSPLAEGIFLKLLKDKGLEEHFEVDSAGTSSYHHNEPAHEGSRKVAAQFKVDLPSRSRQVKPADFSRFDYLIAMDNNNKEDLELLQKAYTGNAAVKIVRLLDFDKAQSGSDVQDPYGYGDDTFLSVYHTIEEGCQGFLNFLIEKHGLPLSKELS